MVEMSSEPLPSSQFEPVVAVQSHSAEVDRDREGVGHGGVRHDRRAVVAHDDRVRDGLAWGRRRGAVVLGDRQVGDGLEVIAVGRRAIRRVVGVVDTRSRCDEDGVVEGAGRHGVDVGRHGERRRRGRREVDGRA